MRPARRHGATLISALMSMFLLTVGITIVLQSYLVGSHSVRLSSQRNAVTLALQSQLEALIAAGYGQLPSPGARAVPTSALPAVPAISGQVLVAKGPVANTRTVTAAASWNERGPRQEQLTILMTSGRWGR